MIKYNIIIVGAGPAGCYLAYKLKNQGLDVLLLEKKTFPRYKACAGGLSKKAYDILFSENKNIKNIIEKTVKKQLFVRNKKFTLTDPKKELIYMTYRSDLDNFLMKMAVDNKTVYFKDNVIIQKINKKDNTISFLEKNKEKKISYDVLVGAWGGNVFFNKFVGLYPFERFDLSSSWEGPVGPKFSKYFDEYVLSQIMKKYPGFVCYIFPKSELITAGIFTSKYPFPPVWKYLWNDFMDFWKLDKSIKPHYAVIPIRDPKKPVAKDNILLVGDAAGLADPFVGEGIYYAFISSMIAAKNIINFFKKENYDLAGEYNKNIDSKLLDVLKWARAYESFFNRYPNLSFWSGSECSLGNEIVNSFITGDIKYNEVKKIIKHSVRRIFS